MKKLLIPLLAILVLAPIEDVSSAFGIGVYGASDQISVSGWSDSQLGGLVTLKGNGFDGAVGLGGFLYIDAIPFIDIEASFESVGQEYDFQFDNALASLDKSLLWGRLSTYVTLRRKLIGFGLPVLGGVKFYVGGGINNHNVTPRADFNMLQSLMGGGLEATFDPTDLGKKLASYVKDNRITAKGYHAQAGVQIKLLSFNAFVNYRLTFSEDVVPDAESFSSLWVGLAFGI
ncbi:MAG: hypothetical protein ACE5GH_01835 [Fidelibacterota bacterium]